MTMTPSREATTDDSSTEDNAASQTTEDGPNFPRVSSSDGASSEAAPFHIQVGARLRYELKGTLSGHTISISSVKFSPGGTLSASCAADNVAKTWSPFSGELVRNLNEHTKGLSDIAWSPNSVYLATASDDHTIWDGDTGLQSPQGTYELRILRQLQHRGHAARIRRLRRRCEDMERRKREMHQIDSLIVSCSLDGLIHSFPSQPHAELAIGQCFKMFAEGHNAICQHVQFSPNSKYILSTAHDSAIRLWDFQTSRCLKTYVGHQNAKYCIAACFYVMGAASGSCPKTARSIRATRRAGRSCRSSKAIETHRQQNMIASGSIDSDLTVKVWVDRVST